MYEPSAFQYPTNGGTTPAYGVAPLAYGSSAPVNGSTTPAYGYAALTHKEGKEGKNEPVAALSVAYQISTLPSASSCRLPTLSSSFGGKYSPKQGFPPYNQGGYLSYN